MKERIEKIFRETAYHLRQEGLAQLWNLDTFPGDPAITSHYNVHAFLRFLHLPKKGLYLRGSQNGSVNAYLLSVRELDDVTRQHIYQEIGWQVTRRPGDNLVLRNRVITENTMGRVSLEEDRAMPYSAQDLEVLLRRHIPNSA